MNCIEKEISIIEIGYLKCGIYIKKIENNKTGIIYYECDNEIFIPKTKEEESLEFSYFAFETDYNLNKIPIEYYDEYYQWSPRN